MSTLNLGSLLAPSSVAIVGASNRETSPGYTTTKNLINGTFNGQVFFVNQRPSEIFGKPCYRKIKSLPCVPDLAVIIIPARKLKRCLSQCAQHGIKMVMIMSGTKDSKDVQRHAIKLGIRILGPYCAGLIRPHIGLNISLSTNIVYKGSLALVSESASLGAAILDWAQTSKVGFSTLISTGENADVSLSDVLDLLSEDWQTRAVIVYVESVSNARSFMSALSAIARIKPVVLMRSAQQATQYCEAYARTGEILTSDNVMQVALNRAGAVQIRTFTNLFAAAKILSSKRRVRGNRLAIVSNGAAPAMMAMERASIKHFQVPPIEPAPFKCLQQELNEKSLNNNPFVARGLSTYVQCMHTIIQTLCTSDNIDAVLIIYVPDSRNDPNTVAHALVDSLPGSKPILACWMGDSSVVEARETLSNAEIATFRTPEAAVDGFDFLHRYHVSQQQLLQLPNPLSRTTRANVGAANELVDEAIQQHQRVLNESASKKLLQLYDITTSSSRFESNMRLLSISLYQDVTFGPVIQLGIAGEINHPNRSDTSQLPPLNRFLIDELLNANSIKNYLGQYQEHHPVSTEAVAHVLRRISEMACEIPALYSLNIDSLLVTPDQAVAKDVHICIQKSRYTKQYGHLAIHPYPWEWVKTATLKNGTTIQLRPIRPEDASSIRKLVKEMSPESRYFRFMHAVNELSPHRVAQFTKLDYDRQMAFVACSDPTNVVGVSRYVTSTTRISAEFAISISDSWKERGLAKMLMLLLIEHAIQQNIEVMHGDVLTNNFAMHALMNALDFKKTDTTENDDVIRFEKVLSQ